MSSSTTGPQKVAPHRSTDPGTPALGGAQQPASAAIRVFRPDDAPRLNAIYRSSVERRAVRTYTAEQISAWASCAPPPERFLEIAAASIALRVAVDGADRPLAFASLEGDGHIGLFYAAPGIARAVPAALLDDIERLARRNGQALLYAEISETARMFFERAGFAVDRRRDFEMAGTAMYNYAMSKRLG